MALTGIAGADVGGFFGNADSELITRWNQLGTYYPFFRGHGHLETKRREPWLFGEDNTRRNRHSLRERYALLPYLYTLFWESHTQGTPIMRPMWYEFPEVIKTTSCYGNAVRNSTPWLLFIGHKT